MSAYPLHVLIDLAVDSYLAIVEPQAEIFGAPTAQREIPTALGFHKLYALYA